jgi:CspA family cold shock protein
MFYGLIRAINYERGFGFIEQNGGKDVYFHATILEPGVFDRLMEGQPVKFELQKRDPDEKPTERKGPRAAIIELIDRMPGGVLSDPPPEHRARHHPKAQRRKATWKRKIVLGGAAEPDVGAPGVGATEAGDQKSEIAEG